LKRGDIYSVDLEPTKGREQRGRRPVIIITTSEFNLHNPPIVCPITGGGAGTRLKGFAVSLMNTGMKTDGVVICSQPRVLDVKVRGGKYIERAPEEVINEVMAALQDIVA
jgi:mRNA interferase ChpB